jgi:hypothetical protein
MALLVAPCVLALLDRRSVVPAAVPIPAASSK